MSTTINHQIDDQKCKLMEIRIGTKQSGSNLDNNYSDFISTLSPFLCENQTQTPLDEIEDRINVVVPYLVIIGRLIQPYPIAKIVLLAFQGSLEIVCQY